MSQQRPKGLKRARQEEKEQQNLTEEGAGGEAASEPSKEKNKKIRIEETTEEAGDELNLVVEGEDGEEADEFEEAKAIFQSALTFVEQDNVTQATTLLNGTVHEFDRMLKENKHPAIHTAEFYRIYGEALRELGMVRKDFDFFEVALDRFDSSLEVDDKYAPALWGKAKTLAEEIFLSDQTSKGNTKYKELAAKCEAAVEQASKLENQESEVLGFCQFLQTIAISMTGLANYSLNSLAIKHLDALAAAPGTAVPRHEILVTKGLCLMSFGAEKFEDNKKREARAKLESASAIIEEGIKAFEATRKPHHKPTLAKYLASLGESLVHYANTVSGQESEPVYTRAVEKLKEAQALSESAVPEALAQFVHDWENPQGEEGEGSEEDDDEDDDDDDNKEDGGADDKNGHEGADD